MSICYFSNFQGFELFLLAETIDVPFSFLRGEKDRKEGYKRLVKHSAIWVNATKLTALTSTATSVSKYARQLMWDVIISTKDIKKMNTLKGKGVGFVKMFGDEHLKDVYGERDTMCSNAWFLNTAYSPVFTVPVFRSAYLQGSGVEGESISSRQMEHRETEVFQRLQGSLAEILPSEEQN